MRWYDQGTPWSRKVWTATTHALVASALAVATGAVAYLPGPSLPLWCGLGAGVGGGFYIGRETTEAQRDLGTTTLALSWDRILDLVGGLAGALAGLAFHLNVLPEVLRWTTALF